MQEANNQPEPQTQKKQQITNQLSQQEQKQEKQKDSENKQQELKPAINRYTLYRESFNWDIENFNIQKAVEDFGTINEPKSIAQQNEENGEIWLKVAQSAIQGTGMSKHTAYIINGKDKNGQFQIVRRYSDFILLREKLLLRWPGCFVPPIPPKTLMGNTEAQILRSRIKFLNNFFKKLVRNQAMYYGQQCDIFFKGPEGKSKQLLQKLKAYKNQQLLNKYREAFKDLKQKCIYTEQERQQMSKKITQLQNYLKQWKSDLFTYKEHLRKLAQSKQKYYRAMTRLNTVLLPQYEEVVLHFVNYGLKLEQGENSQEKKLQNALLNSEQYKTTLSDAAQSVVNYNESIWYLYDIFKIQLKETESILQAIDSYRFLLREQEYLQRSIQINKQQIQALNEKKTTLKIFFLGGTQDQKKTKIANQSSDFQSKLQIVEQLLNFVLYILEDNIKSFHSDRLNQYRTLLQKSAHQELVLIKKLIDFHIFQLQLFKKVELKQQQ